jgi:hypothetical protein
MCGVCTRRPNYFILIRILALERYAFNVYTLHYAHLYSFEWTTDDRPIASGGWIIIKTAARVGKPAANLINIIIMIIIKRRMEVIKLFTDV